MSRAALVGVTALLAAVTIGSGRPAAAADDVTLTLTGQTYAIAADAPWSATFDATGVLGAAPTATTAAPTTSGPSSTTPVPVVEAQVQAHRPVTDRGALRTVRDGDAPPIVSRRTVPVALVGTAQHASFRLTIPTTRDPAVADALLLTRSGVYPITVSLVIDGEIVGQHETFLERLPVTADDGDRPLRVAVVGAVDDPGPAADAAARASAAEAIERLAVASAALEGPLSVQLPPASVQDLDAATLAELRAALVGDEVLATPALALDPSSAVAAGQTDAFSSLLRTGEDLLDAAFPDSPPQRSAWLAATPLSAGAATVLRDPLGFDLLVVDGDVYDGLAGAIGGYHDPTLAFRVELDDGSTLPGIVVHPASAWLDAEQLATADMSATDGAIAIIAELRVTRDELGPDANRSAVLRPPPGVTPDPAVLAALGAAVATAPQTQLATLSELGSTDLMRVTGLGPETVTLPVEAGIDLAERVSRIELTRINAAGAASMLLDPDRAAAVDADLDQLVSTALTDDEVDARLADISAEAQAVYGCVAMPNPGTFTLTGRASTLRLNLTNQCADALRVVVHPTSSKLTFPSGDIARTLAANAVTEVEVDVRSRSNGTSAITIELRTPVGSLPLPQTLTLTARVNALSGLGQVVTGGALLVLGSWWYQHFRRRRRARRASLGEVDNPIRVGVVSPDAAEVSGPQPTAVRVATDSVSDP